MIRYVKHLRIVNLLFVLFLVWTGVLYLFQVCYGQDGHFAIEPALNIHLKKQTSSGLKSGKSIFGCFGKCIDIKISSFYITLAPKSDPFKLIIVKLLSYPANFSKEQKKKASGNFQLSLLVNKRAVFLNTVVLLL